MTPALLRGAVTGDYVQYLFDTGAMGYSTLYGKIVAAGPKTVTVLWESGNRNRVRRDHRDVKPCQKPAELRGVLA